MSEDTDTASALGAGRGGGLCQACKSASHACYHELKTGRLEQRLGRDLTGWTLSVVTLVIPAMHAFFLRVRAKVRERTQRAV